MQVPPHVSQPHPKEKPLFDQLFHFADGDRDGVIGVNDAVQFLRRSGLSDTTLHSVWGLVKNNQIMNNTPSSPNSLSLNEFCVSLRLITLALEGRDLDDISVLLNEPYVPLPKIEKFHGQTPQPNSQPQSQSQQSQLPQPHVPPQTQHPQQSQYNQHGYSQNYGQQSQYNSPHPSSFSSTPVYLAPQNYGSSNWSNVSPSQFGSGSQFSQPTPPTPQQTTSAPKQILPTPQKTPPTPQQTPPTPQQTSSIPQQTPPTPQSIDLEWSVSQLEKDRYGQMFLKTDTDNDGYVSGEEARFLFSKSGLPMSDLSHIWSLSKELVISSVSPTPIAYLDRYQFTLAMYFINKRMKGSDLPQSLPSSLSSPSFWLAQQSETEGSIRNKVSTWGTTIKPSNLSTGRGLKIGSKEADFVTWGFTPQEFLKYSNQFEEIDINSDGILNLEVMRVNLEQFIENGSTDQKGDEDEGDDELSEEDEGENENEKEKNLDENKEKKKKEKLILKKKLTREDMNKIWILSNPTNVPFDQQNFSIAMYLVDAKLRDCQLPEILPPSMFSSYLSIRESFATNPPGSIQSTYDIKLFPPEVLATKIVIPTPIQVDFDLQQDIENLKQQIEQMEKKSVQMEQYNKQVEQQNLQLQNQLEKIRSQNELSQSEQKSYSEQFQSLVEKQQSLASQMDSARQEYIELQSSKNDALKSFDESYRVCTVNETQIEELRRSISWFQQQRDQAVNRLEELKHLEPQQEALKQEYKIKCEQLNRLIQEREKERDEAKEKLEKHQESYNTLWKTVQDEEQTLDAETKRVIELNFEIEHVKSSENTIQQRIQYLTHEYNQVKSNKSQISSLLNEKRKQQVDQEDVFNNLQNEINSQKKEHENLQASVVTKASQVDEIRQKIQLLTQDIIKMKREVDQEKRKLIQQKARNKAKKAKPLPTPPQLSSTSQDTSKKSDKALPPIPTSDASSISSTQEKVPETDSTTTNKTDTEQSVEIAAPSTPSFPAFETNFENPFETGFDSPFNAAFSSSGTSDQKISTESTSSNQSVSTDNTGSTTENNKQFGFGGGFDFDSAFGNFDLKPASTSTQPTKSVQTNSTTQVNDPIVKQINEIFSQFPFNYNPNKPTFVSENISHFSSTSDRFQTTVSFSNPFDSNPFGSEFSFPSSSNPFSEPFSSTRSSSSTTSESTPESVSSESSNGDNNNPKSLSSSSSDDLSAPKQVPPTLANLRSAQSHPNPFSSSSSFGTLSSLAPPPTLKLPPATK